MNLNESARSDKFTGGIGRAAFQAHEPDIRITVNVPAFRLTLWQNNMEVKTYPIGVGLQDYPIYIGELKASEVIWNPSWIPPDSDWVTERGNVKAGQIITASDPLNPLGKLKIPLGYGYLIHEAKGAGDLGNLVSHGCIRMMRADLYDLAEKIVRARDADVTAKQINNAKLTKKTLAVALEEVLPIDINYDTQVVEGGKLYIYDDVYGRKTNTIERLRRELTEHGVAPESFDEQTFERILNRVTRTRGFVVPLESIAQGNILADGTYFSIVPTAKTTPVKRVPRRSVRRT